MTGYLVIYIVCNFVLRIRGRDMAEKHVRFRRKLGLRPGKQIQPKQNHGPFRLSHLFRGLQHVLLVLAIMTLITIKNILFLAIITRIEIKQTF